MNHHNKYDSGKLLIKALEFWNWLIGKPDAITRENVAFNTISVFTIALLLVLLPINIYFGLRVVALMLLLAAMLQIYFYYLSRFKQRYKKSMGLYAGMSYVILTINFVYNAGSDGPTIYLFFLTYLLLIAFTHQRYHWLWTVLHIAVSSILLSLEHYFPLAIPIKSYDLASYRFIDLTTCFVIIIICIYTVTSYLRNIYEQEKSLAEHHAEQISGQNSRIQLQNNELKRLNSEHIKLISILAHDLRNPLNAITGVLEILTKDAITDEKRKRLKSELLYLSKNTSDMLSNLLSWTSRQIKGIQPTLVMVSPIEVISQVLNIQALLAAKKKIRICTDIDPQVEIFADFDMLELVLRNLVNNALKFTTVEGEIHIRVDLDEGRKNGIISISDNGIGMGDEYIHQLFNANISSTYGTDNEKGIGLGLFLCKEFILAQHGKIWLESTPGYGTVFYISLPLFDMQGKATSLVENTARF
ncbi:Signal transduction histidine kinase [bacterium A37T11]|nr:Signal transduction histidine kinase [bacterium A37T11]